MGEHSETRQWRKLSPHCSKRARGEQVLLEPDETRRLPVVRGRHYCKNCGLKGRNGSIHILISFSPSSKIPLVPLMDQTYLEFRCQRKSDDVIYGGELSKTQSRAKNGVKCESEGINGELWPQYSNLVLFGKAELDAGKSVKYIPGLIN